MRVAPKAISPKVTGGGGKYQRTLCSIKDCDLRTFTPTTEYCAVHFQKLVGKPGLKEWLKQHD